LPPAALLTRLHAIEARFGRVRGERNAARSLDLDLLAYGEITSNAAGPLILPHPRMHQRAFVLAPLCDIAPAWRHPGLHRSAAQLLAALAPEQTALPIVGDGEA
jgi:2-amino-4-hydroxy-6-hydroxymethyldihydropteridine diphosphokinase